MKAKIVRGNWFLGALKYAHGKGEAEKVGGNMSGQTVQELSREFGITRKLRPDCKNPVWHCSLALPAGDRLSSEKWDEVSADFMQEMGFDPSNFLYDVQRHSDTDHDHIHIVASRIGIDGRLWHGQNDVFQAIEATQIIEKRHSLTLTPGLEMDEKKDRKSLKPSELNMAIRTEMKPPRTICQDAIDEVLRNVGVISAPNFIKQLAALGVRAVPSVASTGMMNGFSFEAEGIAFTGSKLGESYKWAKLQKQGVSYVKDRDFEELADARRSAAERAGAGPDAVRNDGAAGLNSKPSQELGAAAGSGGRPSDEGAGAIALVARGSDEGPSGLRPGRLGAAIEPGGAGHRDEQSSSRSHGSEDSESQRSDNSPVRPSRRLADQHGSNAGEHRAAVSAARGSDQNGPVFSQADAERGQGVDSSGPLSQADVVANAGPTAGRSGSGVATGGGWASRFKQASAAKRDGAGRGNLPSSVGQGNLGGTRVNESDRVQARQVDPTAYLEALGFKVVKEGRHLSVREHGDEVYRVTRKDDGHWVTCDKHENGVGDNIALVQELEPGTGFGESVYRLSGAPSVAKALGPAAPAPVVRQPPTVPAQTEQDVQRGREYLRGRGITLETIQEAEKSGMLRYSAGGVLFVGRDEAGMAQNIMRRAVDPSEAVQKRDLKGSDKRHPQMLPGSAETVFIVEGGIDGLAALDIARRENRPAPTVLVSGGANVTGFMQTPWVQRVLKLAKKVVVAFEREKSPEVQAKTDAAHELQMQRLREVCGATVEGLKPPDGVKDIAALNSHQVQQIEHEAAQAQQKYASYSSGRLRVVRPTKP